MKCVWGAWAPLPTPYHVLVSVHWRRGVLMMPLARFFHLAAWHEALAITKGHFIEATGSACRAVALGSVACFTVSPSPLFWHVYVLGPAYFVWPWKSSAPHRTTPGSLSATDTCIVYHVTHFEVSRNFILHTRYVSTCVSAGCGRGRETMNNTVNVYFPMYMSDLRHIHDPVLSSLKMEGIRLFQSTFKVT
jgi:hypothetical protein